MKTPENYRPKGKRPDRPAILVVEDMLLIAMELGAILRQLGFRVVGPVPELGRAISLAHSEKLDGAILDIGVKDGQTFDLARQLRAEGVLVVFVTGYAAETVLPHDLCDLPFLQKPIDRPELEAVTRELFGCAAPKPAA